MGGLDWESVRTALGMPDPACTRRGQLLARLAMAGGIVAPFVEYSWFLCEGLYHKAWVGDWGTRFIVLAVLGALVLIVAGLVAWLLLYPLLMLASNLVRLVVARRVPVAVWQRETTFALWPLPYAALAGSATWLIDSFGNFGGWPSDVVFGAIGNAIGAVCYLSILIRWFRVARAYKPHRGEGE